MVDGHIECVGRPSQVLPRVETESVVGVAGMEDEARATQEHVEGQSNTAVLSKEEQVSCEVAS